MEHFHGKRRSMIMNYPISSQYIFMQENLRTGATWFQCESKKTHAPTNFAQIKHIPRSPWRRENFVSRREDDWHQLRMHASWATNITSSCTEHPKGLACLCRLLHSQSNKPRQKWHIQWATAPKVFQESARDPANITIFRHFYCVWDYASIFAHCTTWSLEK
jgi:hypothetical protein